MTSVTFTSRDDVGSRLAGCLGAIVTARAGFGDTGMVKRCRRPGRRNVTILADIACRDVVGGLARRETTVVAADTVFGGARR